MHLTFEKLAGVQYYTIFKKHTFHYFASCIPALFALVDSTEKKTGPRINTYTVVQIHCSKLINY